MTLSAKWLVKPTSKSSKPEAPKSYQAGTTVVQYVGSYCTEQGKASKVVSDFVRFDPTRDWVSLGADAAVCFKNLASAIATKAQRAQAADIQGRTLYRDLGETLTVAGAHGHSFMVKLTDEINDMLAGITVGGDTQVAIFKAKSAAKKAVRIDYKAAYDGALERLLAVK
jgi:hypothetical protein